MLYKWLEFMILGLFYYLEGGFLLEKFLEIVWVVWDVICLDNVKVYYVWMVKNCLENLIGCFMNFGLVVFFMRRGIIECFF